MLKNLNEKLDTSLALEHDPYKEVLERRLKIKEKYKENRFQDQKNNKYFNDLVQQLYHVVMANLKYNWDERLHMAEQQIRLLEDLSNHKLVAYVTALNSNDFKVKVYKKSEHGFYNSKSKVYQANKENHVDLQEFKADSEDELITLLNKTYNFNNEIEFNFYDNEITVENNEGLFLNILYLLFTDIYNSTNKALSYDEKLEFSKKYLVFLDEKSREFILNKLRDEKLFKEFEDYSLEREDEKIKHKTQPKYYDKTSRQKTKFKLHELADDFNTNHTDIEDLNLVEDDSLKQDY